MSLQVTALSADSQHAHKRLTGWPGFHLLLTSPSRLSILGTFENISLYEGAVEVILPEIVWQIKPIDLVVLDPPRAGLNAKARQALSDLAPKEIIYISCDPSTLARDLKHFGEAGYNPQSVRAFDMFPQTADVETLAALRQE